MVCEILRDRPLRFLRDHRDAFTQSSTSTASQRARELKSFGPDPDYKPSRKRGTKASQARALSKMITHAQKEGQQPDMEAVMKFLKFIDEGVSYDADDEDEDGSEENNESEGEGGNGGENDGGDEDDNGYEGEDEYESKVEVEVEDEGDDDDDDEPANY